MKKSISLLIFLTLFVSSVSAGDYYRERSIIGAGIYYTGEKSLLIIDIDGDKSGMAVCATTRRFSISSDAPHYKEMVKIAMAAYTSGQKTVDLYVKDSCNYWGNSQDLLGIKMGKMPF